MNSDWVAPAAFVLSLLSLAFSFATAWLRRPRVSVSINQSVVIGGPNPGDTVRLVVVNHGAEPVTIRNVGLQRIDRAVQHDFENDLQHNGLRVPGGPRLPTTIAGYGVEVWTYHESQLAFSRDDRYIGWATRYRSLPVPTWPARYEKPAWMHRVDSKLYRWPWRITRRRAHIRRHESAHIARKN